MVGGSALTESLSALNFSSLARPGVLSDARRNHSERAPAVEGNPACLASFKEGLNLLTKAHVRDLVQFHSCEDRWRCKTSLWSEVTITNSTAFQLPEQIRQLCG